MGFCLKLISTLWHENWEVHCNVSIDGLAEGRSCAAATQSDQHELLTFQIKSHTGTNDDEWPETRLSGDQNKEIECWNPFGVDEWSNYQFTRLFIALQLRFSDFAHLFIPASAVKSSRKFQFAIQFLSLPLPSLPLVTEHHSQHFRNQLSPYTRWRVETGYFSDSSLLFNRWLLLGILLTRLEPRPRASDERRNNILHDAESVEDDNDDENCIQGNCTILQMSLLNAWELLNRYDSDRLCECPV